MTNIKRKRIRRAPLLVALFVALGVSSTASPALAGSAARCPQQAGQPCPKAGKPPVPPKQARPKAQPKQVNGPHGSPVWQSGTWQMS